MDNLQSHSFNGIKLHWFDKGQGSVVFFVPGSNGDYRAWTNQVDEFSKHFRTIIVSRRFQFPDKYPKGGSSSIDDNSDDLYQLFGHLNISKATVIGHSFGGYVSLAFAEKHPNLIEKLVLEEPTVFTFITSNPNNPFKLLPLMLKNFSAATSFMRTGLKGIKPTKKYLALGQLEKAKLSFADGIIGHRVNLNDLNPIMRQGLEDNIATFAGESKTAFSYPLSEERLKNVTVKTLLLESDKSPRWFGYICQQLKMLLPNSELKKISSPTHWLHLDNADEFNKTVINFIKGENE